MNELDILLDTIKNQRWYFFENNDKIIFDKDTGLIWTNLKFFPYQKSGNNPYSGNKAKKLVTTINNQNWGGYNNWKVPTPNELWKMIADKTFPFFTGTYWRINKRFAWLVNDDGVLSRKDLDYEGAMYGISPDSSVNVILCSDALQPANFYSEPRVILEIFQNNKLIPFFKDAAANRLYKQSAKFLILEKLKAEKFNFYELSAKYDVAEINQSPVKFYKAVISVADEVLKYLQLYGSAAAEIAIPFNARYIDSPHLTLEENLLLKNRREKLAQILNLGVEEIAAQILEIRSEAEEMAAYRERIMSGSKILVELYQFENEPRVSFNLLVESIAESVTLAQDKIIFFAENKSFVRAIIDAAEIWSADYISFKKDLRGQFENLCIKNRIEQNLYFAWFEEWRKLRLAIEERFLPLIEFALKGNLRDVIFEILERLNNYKKAVDNFYLAESTIQKRLDVEENPRKFAKNFFNNVQKIINARPKYNEQIFLKKWAESLTD